MNYSILKCRFSVPVARQPALPWQPLYTFCAPLVWGSSSCYLLSMNLIRPPSTELLQFLTGYVTLRCDPDPLTFDLLTLESGHVMPLGWSIRVPSLSWIRLTFPELGRLQFSIDRQLKVPMYYVFLWVKRVKFQILSF